MAIQPKHWDQWRLIDITEREVFCTCEVIQTVTKVAVASGGREMQREVNNSNDIHPRPQK